MTVRLDYTTIPDDEKVKMLTERLYQTEREHFALEIGLHKGPGADPDEDNRRLAQLEEHMDELNAAIDGLKAKS